MEIKVHPMRSLQVAPNGQLRTSSFLGGSNNDVGNGIAIDGNGSIYVVGYTESYDFPGSKSGNNPNPKLQKYNTAVAAGDSNAGDAFIAKVAAPLTVIGMPILPGSNNSFSGTVATFTDPALDPDLATTVLSAVIQWGDGSTSIGNLGDSADGSGSYTVSGSHTYATRGDFPVVVTVTDEANGLKATTGVDASALPGWQAEASISVDPTIPPIRSTFLQPRRTVSQPDCREADTRQPHRLASLAQTVTTAESPGSPLRPGHAMRLLSTRPSIQCRPPTRIRPTDWVRPSQHLSAQPGLIATGSGDPSTGEDGLPLSNLGNQTSVIDSFGNAYISYVNLIDNSTTVFVVWRRKVKIPSSCFKRFRRLATAPEWTWTNRSLPPVPGPPPGRVRSG